MEAFPQSTSTIVGHTLSSLIFTDWPYTYNEEVAKSVAKWIGHLEAQMRLNYSCLNNLMCKLSFFSSLKLMFRTTGIQKYATMWLFYSMIMVVAVASKSFISLTSTWSMHYGNRKLTPHKEGDKFLLNATARKTWVLRPKKSKLVT